MAGTAKHRELEVGDNIPLARRATNERWLTVSTYRTQVLPTTKTGLPTAMNAARTISHRHTQPFISQMSLGLGRLTMSTTAVGNFGSPDLTPAWLCTEIKQKCSQPLLPTLYSLRTGTQHCQPLWIPHV